MAVTAASLAPHARHAPQGSRVSSASRGLHGAPLVAVVPGRPAPARPGSKSAFVRPASARRVSVGRASVRWVYVRRRVLVALVLVAVVLTIVWGAGTVLASRGGDPASASTARPALHSAAATGAVHVVQPGDTLWSLAQRYHGDTLVDDYLDQLIALNGGTAVSVGQAITLP